jgi:hypothetical protein
VSGNAVENASENDHKTPTKMTAKKAAKSLKMPEKCLLKGL